MTILLKQPDFRSVQTREKFFEELYEKAFPGVAAFVKHRNGSLQDAKDVFHDALIILYEKVVTESLSPDTQPDHYVVGIAKHVWLHNFNRDKNSVSLTDTEAAITIPEDYFPKADDQKLLALLERTGKRCLDMLRSIYYDKVSLDKIAAQLGYGSAHSASVQKFKCLEKIRDTVKEKSIRYEDFLE